MHMVYLSIHLYLNFSQQCFVVFTVKVLYLRDKYIPRCCIHFYAIVNCVVLLI